MCGLTAQQSMRMALTAAWRLFCRAAAFLLICRSSAAYAASRRPAVDGLRLLDRPESRGPPAI